VTQFSDKHLWSDAI